MVKLWQLRQRQSLSLDVKVKLSKKKIRDWYEYWKGNVFVSFSGGKDSTVLLDLVRGMYPDVPAVFVDTGLEYPEIKEFVNCFDNVEILKPKLNFKQVLDKCGYPVVSKNVSDMLYKIRNTKSKYLKDRLLTGIMKDGSKTQFKLPKKWRFLINAPFEISDKCCNVMKKEPFKRFEKETKAKTFIGTMATDSNHRLFKYLKFGCNSFRGTTIRSTPLAFWSEKDIWKYLKQKNIPYCSIYNTGVKNTGCIFCMFGVHLEKRPNRFELMEKTHPQLHKYCINKLGIGKVLDYIGIPYQEDKLQTKLTEVKPNK